MIEFYKIKTDNFDASDVWQRIGTSSNGGVVLERTSDGYIHWERVEKLKSIATKYATVGIISPLHYEKDSTPVRSKEIPALMDHITEVFGAKRTVKIAVRPDFEMDEGELLTVEYDGIRYVAVLRKIGKKTSNLFLGKIAVKDSHGLSIGCVDIPDPVRPADGNALHCYYISGETRKFVGNFVCRNTSDSGVFCEDDRSAKFYPSDCRGHYEVIEEKDQRYLVMEHISTKETLCFIEPADVDANPYYTFVNILDEDHAGIWKIKYNDYGFAAKKAGYPLVDVPPVEIKEAVFMVAADW